MTWWRSVLHSAWLVVGAAATAFAIWVAAAADVQLPGRIAAGALAVVGLACVIGSAVGALRSREFWSSFAIVAGTVVAITALRAVDEALGGQDTTSDLLHALAAPGLFVAFSAPRVRGRRQLPGWLLPLGVGAWALALAITFRYVPRGEARVAALVTTVYVAYASGLGTAYLREGRRCTAGIAFVLFGAAAAGIPLGIDRPVMPVAMVAGLAIRYVNERAEARRRASVTPQEAG